MYREIPEASKHPECHIKACNNQFQFREVTQKYEVFNLLSNISTNKATGRDKIPPTFPYEWKFRDGFRGSQLSHATKVKFLHLTNLHKYLHSTLLVVVWYSALTF